LLARLRLSGVRVIKKQSTLTEALTIGTTRATVTVAALILQIHSVCNCITRSGTGGAIAVPTHWTQSNGRLAAKSVVMRMGDAKTTDLMQDCAGPALGRSIVIVICKCINFHPFDCKWAEVAQVRRLTLLDRTQIVDSPNVKIVREINWGL